MQFLQPEQIEHNNNKNTCEKHTVNPANYTGWTCHGGRVEAVHHSLWLQGLDSSLAFTGM